MDTIHYPADWERSALTREGVQYRIRPIRPDDLERERAFIMGMSSASRYMRMMYCMREPSAALLQQFVHVDYRRNMAFVALTGNTEDEHFIGVARYAADTNGPGVNSLSPLQMSGKERAWARCCCGCCLTTPRPTVFIGCMAMSSLATIACSSSFTGSG